MITLVNGDIFQSYCQVLVNPVNCVGVMGKGLALEFKNRFPENFTQYKKACDDGWFRPNTMLIGYARKGYYSNVYILNIPTKVHWRDKSDIRDIIFGLHHIRNFILEQKIKSAALPALGCGLGGLDWEQVRPAIWNALTDLDCDIYVYAPQ